MVSNRRLLAVEFDVGFGLGAAVRCSPRQWLLRGQAGQVLARGTDESQPTKGHFETVPGVRSCESCR